MIRLKQIHVFAILGCIGTCVALISFQPHSTGETPVAESKIRFKTREARTRNPPPVLSDHQMKRIRAAVKSASGSTDAGAAVGFFDELLKDGDLDVLHEVVTQTKKEAKLTENDRLREALMQAIINQYSAGNFPSMGKVIDASYGEGVMAGDFVQILCQRLSDNNLDLRTKAYHDLLQNPPQSVDPIFYVDIAAGAGSPNSMGPVKALDSIPDPSDGWFGTAAANKIVRGWIYRDAVEASTYLKDLPDSEYRDGLVRHMIQYTAENDDFEMATLWANSLTGAAKDSALHLLKQMKDFKERTGKED